MTRFSCLPLVLVLLAGQTEAAELADILKEVRQKRDVPALAGAVILDGEIHSFGATGVRKAGSDVAVTNDDLFHIGSCTKAMTATLIARLIASGKLRATTTIGQGLPDFEAMDKAFRDVTLPQLLCHRSGLPTASWAPGMNFVSTHKLPGMPRDQRYEYARRMLRVKPIATPGKLYMYSNAGVSVAAVIAEQATDTSWEDLIRKELFEPIGMKSPGFGAMGTAGKTDQPWQHVVRAGKVTPLEPGPMADNPPAIAPAGTVHMSIRDWALFVREHVRGLHGESKLLSQKEFRKLHSPIGGGSYAFGWVKAQRAWGNGPVYTHAGSNNQNYAVVWMAPERKFAVVAATNQGGKEAAGACDDVASSVITQILARK